MNSISVLSSPSASTHTSVHGWRWHHWQDLGYLTCDLLQSWSHGFFTKEFWPRSPQELSAIFAANVSAFRLKQVHSNRVLTPSEVSQELLSLPEAEEFALADGLISDRSESQGSSSVDVPCPQAVWAASADCTPVLIGDLGSGRVAAIHAGWRGTAQRIVSEVIARFLADGSALADLRIALGPAIAGEVYQVEIPVALEVGRSISPELAQLADQDLLNQLQQGESPALLPDAESDRIRLDVRQVIVQQLEQLKIEREQVAIAPYCTFQQPDLFFSYRRSRERKVQWSGIVSAPGGVK